MSLPVDVGISIDSLVFKTGSTTLDDVVAINVKNTKEQVTVLLCISYNTGKSALSD